MMTAFLLVIILPLSMVVIAVKAIISYQVRSIEQTFDIDVETTQLISNPMQIMNRVTRGVFNRVMRVAEEEPALLEDIDYLKELNEELISRYSFLMVRKDGTVLYSGNTLLGQRIESKLPTFGSYKTQTDGGYYLAGIHPVLLKQLDFYCQDGAEGTIFVITDVTNIVPQIKESAVQGAISFVLIIIVTALILSLWLYRSIIQPLNVLKTATRTMKEGNLNFSIHGNPDDEIGQLCESFEDMRIHMKELLEVKMQYEKDTSELIANISHDLKTPLTAIKGYAEGILDGVADSPERRDKYVRTIYSKANEMSALVDELAFYAKIDDSNVPYHFVELSVAEYFGDCIDEISLELELRGFELEYENQVAQEARVKADPEQLKRVINNIVGNALKYFGKEEQGVRGKIRIRVKPLGAFIQVEISDNGMGIKKDELPMIFERFYRADASRNSRRGGTGLGLAIAKKIIQDHKGEVWAASEEGVGTTLYFTLPTQTEEKESVEQVKKRRAVPLLRQKDKS